MVVNFLDLAIVTVVAVLVTGPLAGLLWWVDRRVEQPLLRVVVAFAWGGMGALVFNLATAQGRLPASGEIGIAIEGLVGIAVVLAAALTVPELDAPADGIIVGLATGFGWAALAAATGGGLTMAVVPIAGGVPAGAAIATAVIDRSFPQRWLWGSMALAGWLAASVTVRAGLTTASGDGPRIAVAAGLTAAIVAATLVTVMLAERHILAAELADEVRLGTLPGWVATAIPAFPARVRGGWRHDGDERAVLARQLTRLALRKWSLRGLRVEERRLPGLEVVRLRHRLRIELTETRQGNDDETE